MTNNQEFQNKLCAFLGENIKLYGENIIIEELQIVSEDLENKQKYYNDNQLLLVL